MVRAKHQGAWSFRLLALAVGLAFLLSMSGVGYAVQSATPTSEATGTPAPAPVEKPALPTPDPQPVAPAPDQQPAAPAIDPATAVPAHDAAAPVVDTVPATVPAPTVAKAAVGAASLTPAVITPACNNYIEGWKYNDSVSGQPGVAGFTFKLLKQGDKGKWDVVGGSQISDSSGHFKFSDVEKGTYKVQEQPTQYWTAVAAMESQQIYYSSNDGQSDKVRFHNKEQAHKKFELTVSNAPSGCTFSVKYTVNGGSEKTTDLVLSGGKYVAEDESLFNGDTIGYVKWIGTTGGASKLLVQDGSETLTGKHLTDHYLNTAQYSFKGSIEGFKYNDISGHPGLDGFKFQLQKKSDISRWSDVGSPVSSSGGGHFSWTSLDAGTYRAKEKLTSSQDSKGWTCATGATSGDLSVVSGAITNVEFGNREAAHKVFTLTAPSPGPGNDYRISYKVDGGSAETHILSSAKGDKYAYEDTGLWQGDVLSEIQWIVENGSNSTVIHSDGAEILTGAELPNDYQNSWTYAPKFKIEGTKLITGSSSPDGFRFQLEKKNDHRWDDLGSPVTSSDGGHFRFSDLDPGKYRVHELDRAYWECTSDNPSNDIIFNTGDDPGTPGRVNFTNIEKAHKEFMLDSPHPWAHWLVYWITYKVNGHDHVGMLIPNGGGYTFEDTDLHQGDIISDVVWKAGDILHVWTLGSTSGETLTGTHLPTDYVNSFTWDPKVSGHKIMLPSWGGLSPANVNAVQGWEIHLGNKVTRTDSNGYYEFTGVAPGTHLLTEVLKTGWYQVSAPASAVTIVGETDLQNQDFTNVMVQADVSITKAGPSDAHVGQTITYDITVKNTGNTPLHDVAVSDTTIGFSDTVPVTLAPNGTYAFHPTHTIRAGDSDPFVNMASVTAKDLLDRSVGPKTASNSVDVLHPAITLTKTSSTPEILIGDKVTYTLVVTNSGDTPLHDVVVTDTTFGTTFNVVGDLAANGGNATLSFDETLTVAGSLHNAAQAVGKDMLVDMPGEAERGTVAADAGADVFVMDPKVELTKTPVIVLPGWLHDWILPGMDVRYNYTARNTGNVELTDLAVTDNVLGSVGTIPALAPGVSATLPFTTALSISTVNVGMIAGNYGMVDGEPGRVSGSVTARAEAAVNVHDPKISITKTPSAASVEAGTLVTYTYVVKNTGDVPLSDLVVDDDHLGNVGNTPRLAVGDSWTFTSSAVIHAPVTNTATATAMFFAPETTNEAPGYQVEASAKATVGTFLGFHAPILAITKSANQSYVTTGDVVTYTLTIKNTGDLAATGYTVTDTYDTGAMTVSDSGGGTVGDGQIAWHFSGPLNIGATQTISYTLRVRETLPAGQMTIKNHVHLDNPNDGDPTHGKDSYWTLDVGAGPRGLPFLPFTGADLTLHLLVAVAALALAIALRRVSKARTR